MGCRELSIEILYVEGCANHEALVERVRELADRAGFTTDIGLRRIGSHRQAQRLGFLGSPTLRVDGHDAEPGADARADYGLACRLYRTADGRAGAPPDAILAALSWAPGSVGR